MPGASFLQCPHAAALAAFLERRTVISSSRSGFFPFVARTLPGAWRGVIAGALATVALAVPAHAQVQAPVQGPVQQAGLRTMTVAGDEPVTVALFYPTPAQARPIPMGPWSPVVAPGAPVSAAALKGLILLSHGTGGSEFGQHHLATRLAEDGYLVAALRHPGDNWQDRSMVTSGSYFGERPRQVSRVLDALLASPEWAPRIPAGRIGAVGHSAGGYTVLALAGAQAEPARAGQHCRTVQDDAGFCGLAKGSNGAEGASTAAAAPAPMASSAGSASTVVRPLDGARVSAPDPRIRAVVALAPMAVVFTPESLAAVRVPVRLILAEHDQVLNGQYHGSYVAAHVPGADASTVPGAGHFAFMTQPSMSLPSAAGDAAANPTGFDRVAFQPQLDAQVLQFFARQLQ